MSILIKDMNMPPKCCADCWALDDYGDYPRCRITNERRGYKFRVSEKRMDNCPLSNADNALDDEFIVRMAEEGYGAGKWDMFKRITAAYYGKEYYFLQDDGTVYSRDSHTDMSRDDAYGEFIERIREEG